MSEDNQNQEPVDDIEDVVPLFAFEQFVQSLIEQTQDDKTAPYMPENLHALVQLKSANLPIFESLRTTFGGMKVPLVRFDAAIKQQEQAMKKATAEPKKNAADIILGTALDAGYFRSTDGEAYADIVTADGHRETWAVNSDGFERWLRNQHYMKNKAVPSAEALNAVINILEAKAVVEGDECPVFVRTGIFDDNIYLDLCNDQWQVLEISKDGYKVVKAPPVRFRRHKGMKPLPVPLSGGSINELRKFLNVKDDRGFVLLVSWLLMALRGHGPYPILVVVGEQGTAKSTLMATLRQLVDPHSAPLRTLPREVRDLFISANNALVLAFDNLSYMSDWISDALCRLSTGGGFATRALNTDSDEMLFDAMRPILMNGIENVGTRGDLVDRAIILRLEPIPEDKRKPAKQLQAEFDESCPRILGALLDVMVQGLKMLPAIKLDRQPRMADFALWATACEVAAGWSAGGFMQAYDGNRSEANDDVIASSALATAICDLLHQGQPSWEGTATELLGKLSNLVDEKITWDRRNWPQTGKVLSEKLSRVAPALRRIGVEIERLRGKENKRLLKLYRTPEGLAAAPPSPGAPLSVTNGDGLPQTKKNADKQSKPKKFARKAAKEEA